MSEYKAIMGFREIKVKASSLEETQHKDFKRFKVL